MLIMQFPVVVGEDLTRMVDTVVLNGRMCLGLRAQVVECRENRSI